MKKLEKARILLEAHVSSSSAEEFFVHEAILKAISNHSHDIGVLADEAALVSKKIKEKNQEL